MVEELYEEQKKTQKETTLLAKAQGEYLMVRTKARIDAFVKLKLIVEELYNRS